MIFTKQLFIVKPDILSDDTNLIIKGKSPKKLQKQLNLDLRSLCNWLKANKILLNASKNRALNLQAP